MIRKLLWYAWHSWRIVLAWIAASTWGDGWHVHVIPRHLIAVIKTERTPSGERYKVVWFYHYDRLAVIASGGTWWNKLPRRRFR